MAENKRRRVKPNNKILKRMQRKLWVVFGIVCILFVVLIGRVMYIQYTSGDKYEKIVLAQQDVGRFYVSMDDAVFLAQAASTPRTFLQDNPPPVFIDEVQKINEFQKLNYQK